MKKLLCGAVSLSFLLTAVCACGEAAETVPAADTTAAAAAADDPGTTAEAESTREPLDIPASDFGGIDFRILARLDTVYWVTEDIWTETQNGEPINDAVFKRNSRLSEKLNINIVQQLESDVIGNARKAVKAGDDAYGAFVTTLNDNAALAGEGYIMDLYDVPYIDVSNPWWDTASAKDFSIGGRLFGAMGDINTTDNKATWVVFVNKTMANDFGLENHYDVVDSGKWTLDAMHQNCLKVTGDLNGDQVLTPEDRFGAVNQYECVRAFLSSSGGYTVKKDADDVPYLTLNDGSVAALLPNILSFEMDGMAQIRADDFSGKYSDVWTEVNVNGFLYGRALYSISPLTSIQSLREMEDEMGILVLPKNDESQAEYHTTLQYNNATCYSVPMTTADVERTGIIIETMAYESDELTEAYYEITLKRKYANDEESADQLDLCFANRVVDLGLMFDWGGMSSAIFDQLPKGKKDFATLYASKEKSILKQMDKTLAQFEIG